MISKKIERKSKDNYGRLAEYLATAKDPGEKLEKFWMVNCEAGTDLDDLGMAIAEIEATQSQNTRTKSDKTYHMVVSFRDEKPSPEALEEIEREFAKALGFEEHQRIIATHQNTDNFHMHVAYNKIHPDTLKNHNPSLDYRKRDAVCRAMEKKYCLSVDLGKEDKNQDLDQPSTKAKDYEAITWEQSFESYVKEQKIELMDLRAKSKNWQALHTGFAEYGLEIRKRGNGLVIKEIGSKRAVKASSLDRSFSKAELEKSFGEFTAPKISKKITPKKRYQRTPLTKHPKQSQHWKKYLGHIKRKESLAVKAYRNWREFLTADALSDPLAMAIIMFHKKMIGGVEKLLDFKLPKKSKKRFEL
ncbi:MAG: relaxase [Sulfitobacter sp.]|nr:MAG: relaxase [Sulfitobacter sp.]